MAVPGEKAVYRLYDRSGLATADVIALAGEDLRSGEWVELHHPHRDVGRRLATDDIGDVEELLVPVFRAGQRVNRRATLNESRERRQRRRRPAPPGGAPAGQPTRLSRVAHVRDEAAAAGDGACRPRHGGLTPVDHTTVAPADTTVETAREPSPGARLTARVASAMTVVAKPSATASTAVSLTQ